MHIIALMPCAATIDDIADARDICEGCYLAAFSINAQGEIETLKTERHHTLSVLVDVTERPQSREFMSDLHAKLVEKFGHRFNVRIQAYRENGLNLEHRAKLTAA